MPALSKPALIAASFSRLSVRDLPLSKERRVSIDTPDAFERSLAFQFSNARAALQVSFASAFIQSYIFFVSTYIPNVDILPVCTYISFVGQDSNGVLQMTPSPTISRKEVMLAAWAAMRKYGPAQDIRHLRSRLSRELSQAWFDAKERVRRATMTAVDNAREALDMLRNKDRWNSADYAEADRLAQRIAQEELKAEIAADYAEKRELITNAGDEQCTVVFTKADGSERTMIVQTTALSSYVKGVRATQAGQRATITRKQRHPHLMAVWDVEAQAPRSINLATIRTITTGGMAYAYA